ncbi:hypothetical protein CROQUDRAFT_51499 [Cronartium quercuum f. sp. fusiforme G11]|uniref:J domain-containing protein n=1 Tax=Cronartium quercuum f. sp. fusiforme G11 TaxID=708437 RepID=A0A9P6NC77_9BASI|nr:hypothetical protein CROQUDRAFT_51499 [Cronartium quercuum f. sp. fusiforme G11]
MANVSSLEIDYYAVVGVSPTADSNEIRTAYRKASLKVHPDRNPDDPLAAEKFHALNTAFEILLDPSKRSAFDAKRTAQLARAARFAGLDNKRKSMARDLEVREEAYRKQQTDSSNSNVKKQKLEELKAAGVKLRQAKAAEISAKAPQDIMQSAASLSLAEQSHIDVKASTSQPTHPSTPNPLDTLQCTLRFRWSRKKKPELTTSESLAALINSSDNFTFTDIESIVLAPSKATMDTAATSETTKKVSALVCFKSIAVCEQFHAYTQTSSTWANCTITRMKTKGETE